MATCGVQSSVARLTQAAFAPSIDPDRGGRPAAVLRGGAPCQGAPKRHDADERRDPLRGNFIVPSLVTMERPFVDCLPPVAWAMAAPCELTDGPVDQRP
jgi:hypothetical protein